MIVRLGMVAAVACASVLLATPAGAQEKKLGDEGMFIVSAERVSPLVAHNASSSTTRTNIPIVGAVDVETSQSNTTMALLWTGSGDPTRNVYNVPRLALDYTVTKGLTIGGAVYAFFTLGSSSEVKTGSTTTSTEGAKRTIFGIAPRVGYVFSLTEAVAFWPRLGFSFTTGSDTEQPSNNTQRTSSISQLALHVEPMFALMPVRNFGFTLGPVIDIPLTGSLSVETKTGGTSTKVDAEKYSQFHVGLTAGLVGCF
jgi:hypothetical protein